MIKVVRTLAVAVIVSVSLISCREESKETKTVEGIEVTEEAQVEVSEDGEKVEIQDGNTEIKVKKDENGNIEKKKIDGENRDVKIKMEDGKVEKKKVDIDN